MEGNGRRCIGTSAVKVSAKVRPADLATRLPHQGIASRCRGFRRLSKGRKSRRRDTLTVQARTSSGQILTTLVVYSNLQAASDLEQRTFKSESVSALGESSFCSHAE